MYRKLFFVLVLVFLAKTIFATGCAETHDFNLEVSGINWALTEICFTVGPEVPREIKFEISRLSLRQRERQNVYSIVLQDNIIHCTTPLNNYSGEYIFRDNYYDISVFNIDYTNYYECLIETGNISENIFLGFIKNVYQWTIFAGKLRLFSRDVNNKNVYMDFMRT
jgi:hypothetical protein